MSVLAEGELLSSYNRKQLPFEQTNQPKRKKITFP